MKAASLQQNTNSSGSNANRGPHRYHSNGPHHGQSRKLQTRTITFVATDEYHSNDEHLLCVIQVSGLRDLDGGPGRADG